MKTLADALSTFSTPEVDPEKLEAGRRAIAARNAADLGMCQADCPVCAGVGWVRLDVDITHPQYGRLVMCPKVDRWKLPSAARIGITETEAKTLNWSAVKKVAGVTGLSDAIQAVRATLERGYGWVYLYGQYGIGKTLILQVATAEALRVGKDASYTRLDQVLAHLRDAFDEQTGASENARLRWWSEIDFLAIDEFDKLRSTPYANERRFSLLDDRYLAACRQQSATIIASNEPPAALPGWLADRALDGRFFTVEIKGPSQRPGMEYGR